MPVKINKDTHYKCKKCGDKIYWNTHKQVTYCKCGALGVDGCEDYIRLIGDKRNFEKVMK